jgi:hypothetical protein
MSIKTLTVDHWRGADMEAVRSGDGSGYGSGYGGGFWDGDGY